jgi:hypothetical protein
VTTILTAPTGEKTRACHRYAVAGLFQQPDAARRAAGGLRRAGVAEDQIAMLTRNGPLPPDKKRLPRCVGGGVVLTAVILGPLALSVPLVALGAPVNVVAIAVIVAVALVATLAGAGLGALIDFTRTRRQPIAAAAVTETTTLLLVETSKAEQLVQVIDLLERQGAASLVAGPKDSHTGDRTEDTGASGLRGADDATDAP